MKLIVRVPREVDAKYLHCYIQARYWEDASFNDEEDNEEGDLFEKYLAQTKVSKEHMIELGVNPRYAEGFFKLTIDLDKGTVVDWPKGVEADFNYKSVDMNVFVLEDADGNVIYSTRDKDDDTEYVIGPEFMNEYGDYFVLIVNEQGEIKGWDQLAMANSLLYWMEPED